MCEMDIPCRAKGPAVTVYSPPVVSPHLVRSLPLPQPRVEGWLEPGVVLEDVRVSDRCFLNGHFLFHSMSGQHRAFVMKLSEEIR